VPLWPADHVAIRQLVEYFARYLYLPRLKDSAVLLDAISEGVALLTWEQEAFAYADGFDEVQGRYRGLRGAQAVLLADADITGLLVKPDVARRQMEADKVKPEVGAPTAGPTAGGKGTIPTEPAVVPTGTLKPGPIQPKRFHGTVLLDATRVGRDASRIGDEVIAHLAGLVGANVKVTLEVEAEIPSGAPDNVVRTVTENSRTLKFISQGFEKE